MNSRGFETFKPSDVGMLLRLSVWEEDEMSFTCIDTQKP